MQKKHIIIGVIGIAILGTLTATYIGGGMNGEFFSGSLSRVLPSTKPADQVNINKISGANQIITPPIAPIEMLYPFDKSVLNSNDITAAGGITFKWKESTNAKKYKLSLQTGSGPFKPYETSDNSTTYFIPVSQLNLNSMYMWHVIAYDAKNNPSPNPQADFVFTMEQPIPKMLYPSDQKKLTSNEVTTAGGITLKWEQVSNAKKYQIGLQINNGTSPFKYYTTTDSATNYFMPVSELDLNSLHMWSVRAYDYNDNLSPKPKTNFAFSIN